MQRQNIVKHVVSEINAHRLWKKIGIWNTKDPSDCPGPLVLNIKYFEQQLKDRIKVEESLATFARTLDCPQLRIEYDDLFKKSFQTLNRVCEFIGVPFAPMKQPLVKVTSNDLRDAIANFSEARSYFQGTRFASMFE